MLSNACAGIIQPVHLHKEIPNTIGGVGDGCVFACYLVQQLFKDRHEHVVQHLICHAHEFTYTTTRSIWASVPAQISPRERHDRSRVSRQSANAEGSGNGSNYGAPVTV